MTTRTLLPLALVFSAPVFGQVITTEVGTDASFPTTSTASATALGQVFGLAADRGGNVYVADYDRHQVIRIGSSGVTTVIAGNGFATFSGDGGPAINASLRYPQGVAVAPDGSIYIADSGNNRVRRVAADGTISTVAGNGLEPFSGDGGPATAASVFSPLAMAFDNAGNLYIADARHHRIRKVTTAGVISTVAGNGSEAFGGDGGAATAASMNTPSGIALDASGNLYIADTFNHRIRRVGANGVITTYAGSGPGYADGAPGGAAFSFPKGIAFDSQGNLYVADPGNNRIRRIDAQSVSTVAGAGARGFSGDSGPPSAAELGGPSGVAFDASGTMYVADTSNGRVRALPQGLRSISTFAGNGRFRFSSNGLKAENSLLLQPQDIKIGPDGLMYIVDAQNNRVVRVNADGSAVTVAGGPRYGFSGDGGPATNASLYYPRSLAFDRAGNMYIADCLNLRIRRVNPQGIITTFAGNGQPGFSGDAGPATQASFNYPIGVATDSAGNVYISDSQNNRIRKVGLDGRISTIAGTGRFERNGDGPALQTSFGLPERLWIDANDRLYIADTYNHLVRTLTPEGNIRTLAGTGTPGYTGNGGPATAARVTAPISVTVTSNGTVLWAESFNHAIRAVLPDGTIAPFAGTGGVAGFAGDGGLALNALLNLPMSAIVDGSGVLHIADTLNNRVRRVLSVAPTADVSPKSLSFTAPAGGAPTSTKAVEVASSVAGLPFTATADAPWIQLSLANGNTPTAVAISVDPTNLAPGSYSGVVTIAAPLASAPALTVAVSAAISGAQPPKLSITKTNVQFAFLRGGDAGTETLAVANEGGGELEFAAAVETKSGGNWLTVTPANGAASAAQAGSVTLEANPAGLAAGTYTAMLKVTGTPEAAGAVELPVIMTVSAPTQKVLLSQTGLTFTAVAQGGAPLAQEVGILNGGSGSMPWTATSATLSGGPSWLTLTGNRGTVARPLADVSKMQVAVNAAGLAPGDYFGKVVVNAPGADNSPQTVTVLLNVLPAGTNPGPQIQPSGLIFAGSAAESPGSQSVAISNLTSAELSYGSSQTYLTPGTWLQVAPSNASVAPNAPVQIAVQPDFSKLPSGVSRAYLNLGFSDGSSRTVSILAVNGGATGTSGKGGRFADGCTPTSILLLSTSSQPTFSASLNQPTTLDMRVVDNCGDPVTPASGGAAVNATFNNGDPSLNLVHTQQGRWSATWQPRRAGSGSVRVTVTGFLALPNGRTLGNQTVLTASVTNGAAVPLVTPGAVLNGASFAARLPVAPGSLISVFGSQLALERALGGTPIPTSLAGTEVVLGGKAVPLLFASDGQLNAMIPYDVPVNTQLQLLVQRGEALSVGDPLSVAAAQPAIFTQNQQGTGQAAIVNGVTNVLADAANPVRPGDVVTIYCTGLGVVSPAIPTGTAAPSSPLSRTVEAVSVTIGGVAAQVTFAGLAPGFAGLYQVNAVVPGVAAGGAIPVTLGVAGQTSPEVTIAVQ
ncbi:MAG: hypothetical protein R2729_21205 [Bryobacteraceae bacterium]